MAISFVGASTPAANANGKSTIIPAATVAGDYMVMIGSTAPVASTTATLTAPTGWDTLLPKQSYAPGLAVFGKVATAADAGTQITAGSNNNYVNVCVVVWRGVGSVSAISTSQTNLTAPPYTAPTLTTTVVNSWVVEVWGGGSSSGSTGVIISPPATVRAATAKTVAGSAAVIGVSDQIQVTPGPTSAQTATSVGGGTTRWAAISLVLAPKSIPPNAPVITSPAAGSTVDPRLPLNGSFTYSDSQGQAQTGYTVDASSDGGGTWTRVATGTTATSFTIPANTLPDTTAIQLRVATANAGYAGYSAYGTVAFTSDSWTYTTEVTGSATTASLDTTGFTAGSTYDVEVRVANSNGYSNWSPVAPFQSVLSNVAARVAGAWSVAPRYIRAAATWVLNNPVKK